MYKKAIFGVIGFTLLVFVGAIIWMSVPYSYQQQSIQQVLEANGTEATADGWLVFRPTEANGQGIIFYPGGKTVPQTFAPLMQALSEQGYLVVIVSMPLNTPYFGIDKAEQVIAKFGDVNNWHLIGHSQGGAAAAEFAKENQDKISSLVFWASYPGSNISYLAIPTLGLSGAMDKVITPKKVELARAKYPGATRFVEIDGANHWQFGYFVASYSNEEGLISMEEQVQQVLGHTQLFIGSLD